MEVSRDEAIATALLAKFVGQQLNHVSALTTQQSQNMVGTGVDVNKVLSELSIPPQPKPEGPVIQGASVDGNQHEVVLHQVITPVVESNVDIPNPFSQRPAVPATTQPQTTMPSFNAGSSPMAQFLGKAAAPPVAANPAPVLMQPKVELYTPDPPVELPVILDDNILTSVFEKLVKIELQLTKIQKQLKKNNEGKTVKE
jgi:hypothetical protein